MSRANAQRLDAGSGPDRNEGYSRFFLGYLIATAVVCGSLVMVIEILGSRVIGPFFGASLFVWTSLITVTLAALAAGYAAGGVLADRRPAPATLYALILAAGVLALLVPSLKGPVLKATASWGLRSGSFASALLLFGPALFLLGCVTPFLVKLAARELRSLGRTVGLFAALSTCGSLLGTVLIGFVLIAYLRVTVIFFVVGTLLLVLGAGFFLFFRRSAFALVLLVLPPVLLAGGGRMTTTTDRGAVITVVRSEDTPYGSLKVVDYDYGSGLHRELMIDGLVQGGMDLRTGLPTYEYLYLLPFLAYGTNPHGRTCLVLGLGAGLIPRWFESQGIRTDVVDIDPEVAAIARDLFGFRTSGQVVTADARYYLQTTDKTYDYIVLDVYSGDSMPAHMLSIEALQVLRKRMSRQGVLAVNLIGNLGPDRFMTASIVRTMEQVFRTVTVYPNFEPGTGEDIGNITLIAHDGAFSFDRTRVARFPVNAFAAAGVFRSLGRTFLLPAGERAIILSDDYDPVDFYDLRLKEWIRTAILNDIDLDLLI